MDDAGKIENGGDGYDVPPPLPTDGPQEQVPDDDPDLWEEGGHATLPDDVNDEPADGATGIPTVDQDDRIRTYKEEPDEGSAGR